MSQVTKRIGFMQGRLSPLVNGRIQAFPGEHWYEEFRIANKLSLLNMEWTVDTPTYASNPLVKKWQHSRIREISMQHTVKIPSVTCDFYMENPHWDTPTSDTEEVIREILEGMKQIGASILVIPLVDNSSIRSRQNTDLTFFRQWEPFLRDNQLNIAFELDLDPEVALDFINEFPRDIFGINYDIGNSAAFCFDPIEEINLYGDRVKNVHVKDRVKNGTTVPLGQGDADIVTVIRKLVEAKYTGNYIMQTARSSTGDHVGELSQNIEYFNRCFEYV